MRVCTSHDEHTNPIFLLNYVFLLQSALRIVLQPRYAAWLRQVIIKACLNYRVCTAIYSQEHLSYFSSDHLHFFQQMTSQHLTFSWSAVLWLIERSEDDRNFVVPSYTRTPVIPKELLMISAYIFCTLWFDAVKYVWRNALVSLLPNIKEIDSQVWKNFVHLSNFYLILWTKGRRMLNWSLKFVLLIDWWA